MKLLCSNTLVDKTMNYFSFANTCVSDDDDIDYDDNGGSGDELSVCGCDAYDEYSISKNFYSTCLLSGEISLRSVRPI